MLQEKFVQVEAAECSAMKHRNDDEAQDVKPAAEDADKSDGDNDDGDYNDDEEEFDSSDEQILTKSGESTGKPKNLVSKLEF